VAARKARRKKLTSLDVLRDLMFGARHSRRTLMTSGLSGSSADRRLRVLVDFPGIVRTTDGKVGPHVEVWFQWVPSQAAKAIREAYAARGLA
jgi:hypothetical protein